ncbi:MAG: glycosyltransferase family 9 protein [Verrucomicrobia bacterium]|nr:glycosyltransferase family 9 protein [Verrucomicrobiota bacterium]
MASEFNGRPVRRVLLYRLGSLGDTLIVLPAFHLVRRRFPDAHITLLTNRPISAKASAMESVLANTGVYDDALSYPSSTRSLSTLRELRRTLAQGNYDLLAYLAKPKGGWKSSLKDWVFFRSCGIRQLVGIPFTARNLRPHPLPDSNRYRWDCERAMDCLTPLGRVDLEDPAWWDLKLTRTEHEEADKLLAEHRISRPFLVFSIGTKAQANDWEERNWTALLDRLARTHGSLPIVMLGAAEEADYSARLLARWPGVTANLCGRSSPRVSGAILQRALLFVGHDSGPMHLAGTVGTPLVAIYSARAVPGEWFPRGRHNAILYHQTDCFGCALNECIAQKKKCILSITVDEVHDAVLKKLATLAPEIGA